jgi:hypothetical protein
VSKSFFNIAAISLRIALALAFLSAVADRFGLWGKPGRPGVSWGNMTQFNAYVAKLNWFLPAAVIPLTLGRDRGRDLARFGSADLLAFAMGLFGQCTTLIMFRAYDASGARSQSTT